MRFTERTGKAAHHAAAARAALPNSSPHDDRRGPISFDVRLTADISREVVVEARERGMHPQDLIALIVTDAVLKDAEGSS